LVSQSQTFKANALELTSQIKRMQLNTNGLNLEVSLLSNETNFSNSTNERNSSNLDSYLFSRTRNKLTSLLTISNLSTNELSRGIQRPLRFKAC